MKRKLKAFTLAEILLAMTIVGVIAAMTIPTLQYQRLKKEYTAKLKNFYSHIENAVLDMQIDKGSFQDMSLPSDGYDWYMENIDPYMGHKYINNNHIHFQDGSSITKIAPNGCLDVSYDVNGDKSPNRVGIDTFIFLFCFDNAKRVRFFGDSNIFFGSYGSDQTSAGVSRSTMISACKSNAAKCSRLLQADQWEFKIDYPYKF